METKGRAFSRTSKTLKEILKGPDCPERRQRVNELVEIYWPVWEATAKQTLRRYGSKNATVEAPDVSQQEIAKMLSPQSDYFKTFDQAKSLRVWIKTCIRHRAIDFLRRRGWLQQIDEIAVQSEVARLIDVREQYELFRKALKSADEICESRNMQKDMEIFRAVRSADHKLSPTQRGERGWSEHQEREAVKCVWDLIRDEAIPEAAAQVSDTPEEAEELAKWLWDQIKNRKTIDLPWTETEEDEPVE